MNARTTLRLGAFFIFGLLLSACAPRVAEANVCRSRDDRFACDANPAGCPCEAYGDCTMTGCLAKGAEVQAERDAAATPVTSPHAASPSSPASPAPSAASAPATSTPAAAAPVMPTTTAPAMERSCNTSADRRQCAEESYYCPCDAYGDCGMDCCKEPTVKPREQAGCRTADDRALCSSDPDRCPCPVGGACAMSGCT